MEKLKQMKETLMSCVQGQMGQLKETDAQELGAAIDMIKDLSEAIYYCTITEAMEKKDDSEICTKHHLMAMPEHNNGYYPPRDMDRGEGRMYYYDGGSGGNRGGNNNNGRGNGGSYNNGGGRANYMDFTDEMYGRPMTQTNVLRDRREGRSPMTRKMYMEAKEMHQGKEVQMQELENYMQELTYDLTDMIKGASLEEKQLLQKKLATLATKVDQISV